MPGIDGGTSLGRRKTEERFWQNMVYAFQYQVRVFVFFAFCAYFCPHMFLCWFQYVQSDAAVLPFAFCLGFCVCLLFHPSACSTQHSMQRRAHSLPSAGPLVLETALSEPRQSLPVPVAALRSGTYVPGNSLPGSAGPGGTYSLMCDTV